MAGPALQSPEVRFWKNVVKQEDGCWIYGSNISYGTIGLGGQRGKTVSAHRFSYELHNGKIQTGLYVCHKCDVKQCVNPNHLYAGTYEDNIQDAIDRDRLAKNSGRVIKTHPPYRYRQGRVMSKRHREQIKSEYASGKFTQMQLASRYRVSQATISATIRNAYNMGTGEKSPRRSGNFRRKVSTEQEAMVRQMYRTGKFTQQQLATQVGCTQANISRIIHFRTKGHIDMRTLVLGEAIVATGTVAQTAVNTNVTPFLSGRDVVGYINMNAVTGTPSVSIQGSDDNSVWTTLLTNATLTDRQGNFLAKQFMRVNQTVAGTAGTYSAYLNNAT